MKMTEAAKVLLIMAARPYTEKTFKEIYNETYPMNAVEFEDHLMAIKRINILDRKTKLAG